MDLPNIFRSMKFTIIRESQNQFYSQYRFSYYRFPIFVPVIGKNLYFNAFSHSHSDYHIRAKGLTITQVREYTVLVQNPEVKYISAVLMH